MRRCLVVANRTLGGEHLLEEVRRRVAEGDCSFHLVVPASHPTDHLWTEAECKADAQHRLDEAVRRFREVGADATGEVGDANPVLAIQDVMLREPFDEIILSTLPPGPSRWIHQDVPSRVRRAFRVPVTHVVAARELAHQ